MSTKFISVNGYEKIERIKGSKKVRKQLAVKTSEKKTKRMDNILSMLYYIVVVPATFFSGIVKFITPSKKNKRKSFSRKKFMYNRVAPTLAIILLVLTVGYWTNWIDFGLNVQLDGQTVASVSDSGVIQHAKEITNDKLNKDTDASFTPVYQIGVVNQNEASNNAQTVSNAMVETDTNVTDDVAGLYVNEELIGVCSSATELHLAEPAVRDRLRHGSGRSGCNVMESINIGNCLGIDQHDYSSEYMLISQENYLKYDLRNPLSLTRKYDIAISVEVAEHIDNKYAKIFIGNLCRHSDVILFSAALPNQGGTGHINEQPCSYWKQIFEKYKYRAIDCIRPVFWNDDTIEIWYRNNSILYVNERLYNDFIKIIPMQVHPLDIVHPEMLARILKKERFK